MRRYAVFMDIDGTLTANASAPSNEVVQQIMLARAQGHQFFLCTGRSKAYIPQALHNTAYLDGYIAGSGTYVCVHDEVLYHQRVPKEALRAACDLFIRDGSVCLFEGEDALYGIHHDHAQFAIMDASDFDGRLKDVPITKLTVAGSVTPQVRDALGKWFGFCEMEGFYEAILHGNTKATGMKKVLDAIGLRREDSIAIGDDINDIPMLQFAGTKIAMGNAPLTVKRIANYVTASCACNGVAVAIKEHVLDKR